MDEYIKKHSLTKSIILHLLPGLLIGACYFLLVPIVLENGFPSIMALLLAGIIALIPFQLGFLLYQKHKTGENFFNGIIPYTNPLKIWQYILLILSIIIISGLIYKALNFSKEYLIQLFHWIPTHLRLDMGMSEEFAKSKLILTYGLLFLFGVVILPTVEEFYFRGYLLPRMPGNLKGWTALTHSALFALYHTWTPWLFISRTIGTLPLAWFVMRKKNVYIGIFSHCILNSIDFVIAVLFISSL